MIFLKQKIKGVVLIKPKPFKDNRGFFRRHYCKNEFKKFGINTSVNQCNISENLFKGTLRGFHYQTGRSAEAKTLGGIASLAEDGVSKGGNPTLPNRPLLTFVAMVESWRAQGNNQSLKASLPSAPNVSPAPGEGE